MNLEKLAKAAKSAVERHPSETGCNQGNLCADLNEIRDVQRAAETLLTHGPLIARILKGDCL